MLFQDEEVSGAQLLQQERGKRFGVQAADRIRAAENCRFSLLPHEELSRLAGDWYQSCSDAMLRGNYSPIDLWIRSQSQVATEQGFTPDELRELLTICRRCAIETEGWSEDIFSAVDDVMREVFGAIHGEKAWTQNVEPEKTTVAAIAVPESTVEVKVEERAINRRRFTRNRLRFTIRARGTGIMGPIDEVATTQSVSRGGLYFLAYGEYENGMNLTINFPYWVGHGAINREYASKIVRLDLLPDGVKGVGVDFLESLGCRGE